MRELVIPVLFGIFLIGWSLPSVKTVIKEVEKPIPVFISDNSEMNFDTMFKYVSIIESGQDPDEIGDNGASYGIVQIQNGAIKDVNRYWGTDYVHNDAFNVKKSRKIFQLYLTYIANTQKVSGEYTLIRCWNGGPQGHKYNDTLDYLARYKQAKGIEI